MIRIFLNNDELVVESEPGDLQARHLSQLALWGFCGESQEQLRSSTPDIANGAIKSVEYFESRELPYKVSSFIKDLIDRRRRQAENLQTSLSRGLDFKEGLVDRELANDFLRFTQKALKRKLRDHQVKAALHLIGATNGANFSVPGAGKTAVVLSVFEWLREKSMIDSIFVVGPPACFSPWSDEYRAVTGHEPSKKILAGGNVDVRRQGYLATPSNRCDMYLTSFQTLQNDVDEASALIGRSGIRFLLVVDEAHYIKQIGGRWATAVLQIARVATRRCVLTGTPFPRSYVDGFNLFETLWPDADVLPEDSRHQVARLCEEGYHEHAAEILKPAASPLFYRVRKADLGLAPQVLNEPTLVEMRPIEQRLYRLMVDRIHTLNEEELYADYELIMRLRRGRMIRLRQCTSHASLLSSVIPDYDEQLWDTESELNETIRNYQELERPAKLDALLHLVQVRIDRGEKVLIWSNFVHTLHTIVNEVNSLGVKAGLIYGQTPFEKAAVREEYTREEIIRTFKRADSPLRVLVANPAACAESISLHKVCKHAIYYDLSYNCAEYLQSLDRIHRVGGSEDQPSHYDFLSYADTIDQHIIANLRRKAQNMAAVIDDEYPIVSLDMFESDTNDDSDAYAEIFGKRAPQC